MSEEDSPIDAETLSDMYGIDTKVAEKVLHELWVKQAGWTRGRVHRTTYSRTIYRYRHIKKHEE